eukprot:7382271-Prymnesium_polylepis.2
MTHVRLSPYGLVTTCAPPSCARSTPHQSSHAVSTTPHRAPPMPSARPPSAIVRNSAALPRQLGYRAASAATESRLVTASRRAALPAASVGVDRRTTSQHAGSAAAPRGAS